MSSLEKSKNEQDRIFEQQQRPKRPKLIDTRAVNIEGDYNDVVDDDDDDMNDDDDDDDSNDYDQEAVTCASCAQCMQSLEGTWRCTVS